MHVRHPEHPTRSPVRLAVVGSLGGKAIEMVTLVLLATVVPRALGPADYGRFAVPLTVVTLGSLALTLGGPTLMARYVPTAPVDERIGLARALGLRLARGRAFQLLPMSVIALGAAVTFPSALPPADVALVVVALWLNIGTALILQMALGLGRTGAWSARFPLQNSVLIVAVLAMHDAFDGRGSLIALVVAGGSGLAFAVIASRHVLTARTTSVAIPAGAIRFGTLQAGGAALVQYAHRGGVLAVAVLAGSSLETGYAALAVGVALGVTYAVLQTFTVSLPHLAGQTSSQTANQGEAVLRRLASALLLLGVVGLVPVALALGTLVPAVFGDEFDGAVAAFGPALAVVALAPLHSLTVQVAALRLRPEVALWSGVAAATTFTVVAAAAVPHWQAAGGTAATLAGAITGTGVALAMLPGAAGPRLVIGSYGAAAIVLGASLIS